MSDVVGTHQSPMNVQRWVLDLKCGHACWINSVRRPTRKKFRCPECNRDELRAIREQAEADKKGGGE